jgi:primosomal protein N' (replication factor Y)
MTELRQQREESRRPWSTRSCERGVTELEAREVPDDPFFGAPVPRDTAPELNDAQATRWRPSPRRSSTTSERAFMLYGVTGSGKTEVYLRAMDAAQAQGAGALLLLPEIALTPQLVSRYRARFGDNLAVLHSGLKDADRHAMWKRSTAASARGHRRPQRRLRAGARPRAHHRRRGARPVLQAGRPLPLPRPRPRAPARAPRWACPACSAARRRRWRATTPRMEGRYRLLHLPDRATSAPMPEHRDRRPASASGRSGPTGHELLSLPLVRAIDATLNRKEQAILFLNRRGFAPSVRCAACARRWSARRAAWPWCCTAARGRCAATTATSTCPSPARASPAAAPT